MVCPGSAPTTLVKSISDRRFHCLGVPDSQGILQRIELPRNTNQQREVIGAGSFNFNDDVDKLALLQNASPGTIAFFPAGHVMMLLGNNAAGIPIIAHDTKGLGTEIAPITSRKRPNGDEYIDAIDRVVVPYANRKALGN